MSTALDIIATSKLYSTTLPSWTTSLIYMLDVTESDQEALERASRTLDKPKGAIKRYLRHPIIQEQRAKYLHLTNQNSMWKLKNLVNVAVEQLVRVITEQKKPDGASEYSIILLKGLGILGTKVVMEHQFMPSEDFKKKVFEELNAKLTNKDWEEAEEWVKNDGMEERENGGDEDRVGERENGGVGEKDGENKEGTKSNEEITTSKDTVTTENNRHNGTMI